MYGYFDLGSNMDLPTVMKTSCLKSIHIQTNLFLLKTRDVRKALDKGPAIVDGHAESADCVYQNHCYADLH